jgi:hypothetical protein
MQENTIREVVLASNKGCRKGKEKKYSAGACEFECSSSEIIFIRKHRNLKLKSEQLYTVA